MRYGQIQSACLLRKRFCKSNGKRIYRNNIFFFVKLKKLKQNVGCNEIYMSARGYNQ